MKRRDRRSWILILGGTVAIVVAMALIWAVASADLRGPLLLLGGVVAAVTCVSIYVIERRVHW